MPLRSETSQIKFNPKDNTILVDCSLKNKNIVFDTKLVFDTGASYTIISWSIANILRLNPAFTKETVTFYSASAKIQAPLLKIEELRVENSFVNNIEIIVFDLPHEAGVYGLLGLNFLRNFEVSLNFNKGIITLTK